MSVRQVNALSHCTDWTVGHVHAGAMGWVGLISFGSIYALAPVLWRRDAMWSWALVEWHYWLALAGTVIHVFAMWNAGITQGLMWRAYTDAGTLQYSFTESVAAMHGYYVARTVGGALFTVGAILGFLNVVMTARAARPRARPLDRPTDSEAGEPPGPTPAE